MRLTDRLKVEHGVFLRQLSYLDALAEAGAPPVVLRAVLEAITVAEEQHALVEERTLYPALREVLGDSAAPLEAAEAEHQQVGALAERMRQDGAGAADVTAFSTALRHHLEREIHDVFRLAEELLSEERLSSLCNWEEEHVFDALGQRTKWIETLGPKP